MKAWGIRVGLEGRQVWNRSRDQIILPLAPTSCPLRDAWRHHKQSKGSSKGPTYSRQTMEIMAYTKTNHTVLGVLFLRLPCCQVRMLVAPTEEQTSGMVPVALACLICL
jgi:hypothetical protein